MFTFFSVIIPTFNRGPILSNAIDSILSQSFYDYEIIVVDDGSTDNTKEIINSFKSEKIKYIYQLNKGVCAARNNGAKNSNGKYLIFLDSDDQLTPDALMFFYNSIIKDQFDIVCGNTHFENKINDYFKKSSSNVFLAGSFCISRKLFNKVDGYDEKLQYGENTELRFRITATNSKIFYIENIVLIYKCSVNGGSKNLINKIDSNSYIVKKHSDYFKKKPQVLQLYHQNIAIAYIKLGQQLNAMKSIRKAWLAKPINTKTLFRMLFMHLPLLPKVYWKKKNEK